ncbi:MAG: Chromate resistance protein ChrB [Nocardioidaceae bacterium]
MVTTDSGLVWLLLNYRLPREPSTPRIAVWRTLKRLGVAQLGDGLVALPADARTQEQLEWVAEEIGGAGGTSTLWRAQLTSRSQERALIAAMARARAEEYRAILDRATTAVASSDQERVRTLRSLRGELRRVHRRDFFPPPERDRARVAVQALVLVGENPAATAQTQVTS